jgi:hypothetical protein
VRTATNSTVSGINTLRFALSILHRLYIGGVMVKAEQDGGKKPPARRSCRNKKASASQQAVAPQTATASKRVAAATEPKEARAKKYRRTCPQGLRDRMDRASSQRMFLVDKTVHERNDGHCSSLLFSVLGSTGNVYDVTLGKLVSCSCPDFRIRRNDICKHVMFVTLKVVGLEPDDPLAFQKAYIQSELDEILDKLKHRRAGGSFEANAQVQASYKAIKEGSSESMPPAKSLHDDVDCPICFDTLLQGARTHCWVCRTNFHADCIQRWSTLNKTCPNCRSAWQLKPNEKKDGFINLGVLQGQSPVRDTSTYYTQTKSRRR